tara:strand:- start:1790 stop:2659 length:870 start_codon:yes stop_codon:yes gene_type:complete
MSEAAFHSFEEGIDAKKIRTRSESFSDHFSQPALFYRSLAAWEQEHIAGAYTFELGKCTHEHIKDRMLWLIAQIDKDLAKKVAEGLGMKVPKNIEKPINQAIGADADPKKHEPGPKKNYLDASPALSQANTKFNSIATRQVAVLLAEGFDAKSFKAIKTMLEKEGAMAKLVAPHGGVVKDSENKEHKVDAAIMTTESVLFDAIHIPDGKKSVDALLKQAKFIKFVNEAFKHCKAIAADGEGERLLKATFVKDHLKDKAIHINEKPEAFKRSIAQHRNWDRRSVTDSIPV